MECANCQKWVIQRVTDYEDGSRIINLKSTEGNGFCEVLKIETGADFGCNKFEEGNLHIEVMGKKPGSPWHHSQWGKCPDCDGVGFGCRRCAGTARVLYYDDGYIGEEQTRRHPNETDQNGPPVPSCISCKKHIDLNWVACPYCGTKIDKQADPVRVDSLQTSDGELL